MGQVKQGCGPFSFRQGWRRVIRCRTEGSDHAGQREEHPRQEEAKADGERASGQ